MVLWTEEFSTGSDAIDQQHKMLFNNLNHLESMLAETNPTPEEGEFLIGLVDFLELYASTHFKFEERCMQNYRCPAHEKNKKAHAQFFHFVQQFKECCKTEGLRVDVLRSLHKTLSKWIQDHIMQVDTQLKPCIQRKDQSGRHQG